MNSTKILMLTVNQPKVIKLGNQSELRIESGTVWLTVPGGDDIFLSAGQHYPLPVSGKVVIESINGEARVIQRSVTPIASISPISQKFTWLLSDWHRRQPAPSC